VGTHLCPVRARGAGALSPLSALRGRLLRARLSQAVVLAAPVPQHLRRGRVGAGGGLATFVRAADAGGGVLRGRRRRARAAQAQASPRPKLAPLSIPCAAAASSNSPRQRSSRFGESPRAPEAQPQSKTLMTVMIRRCASQLT